MVVDENGNVITEIEYDSFGHMINDTAPYLSVPFGFAGGLYDADTDLLRFGHRDYDPEISRWTAKDPMFFAGGDTDLYGYVQNDPVSWIDYRGLSAEVGGGFSFTVPGYHFNTSITTDTCCDDSGKKHKRTIQVTCTGFSIGFAIGGGSGPGGGSVSWGGGSKKCKGSIGDDYYENKGFGFSAGLVVGASWSSDDQNRTTITTELGGSLHFWSKCHTQIKQDVVIGDCCD
jgi:RHS repeat-associated protein